MVRNHGAVSLAFMKGERVIRERKLKKVRVSDLTPDQEKKAGEMSRETGRPFLECAAEILTGQKKLNDD